MSSTTPGEEARYAQVRAVLDAAKADPSLKDAMNKAVLDADADIVKPLFEFSTAKPTTRSFGDSD
jgi:hypothetical protein